MTHPPFPPFMSESETQRLRGLLDQLAVAALAGKVTFLFGAGFSKAAQGLPTGSELAANLLVSSIGVSAEQARSLAEQFGLAAVTQQFGEDAPERRTGLQDAIRQELAVSAKPSVTQHTLASLLSLCRIRRVFTTNFDSIIEDALRPRDFVVPRSVEGVRKFDSLSATDKIGVHHLHGTLEDPLVTEEDLRDSRPILYEAFRSELLTKILIMVGYGFRDDALVAVFDDIRDLLVKNGAGRGSYAVMPVGSSQELAIAHRVWRRRGEIDVIPLGADAFLHSLLDAVKARRAGSAVEDLAKILAEDPTLLSQKLSQLKDEFQTLEVHELAEIVSNLSRLRTS